MKVNRRLHLGMRIRYSAIIHPVLFVLLLLLEDGNVISQTDFNTLLIVLEVFMITLIFVKALLTLKDVRFGIRYIWNRPLGLFLLIAAVVLVSEVENKLILIGPAFVMSCDSWLTKIVYEKFSEFKEGSP